MEETIKLIATGAIIVLLGFILNVFTTALYALYPSPVNFAWLGWLFIIIGFIAIGAGIYLLIEEGRDFLGL